MKNLLFALILCFLMPETALAQEQFVPVWESGTNWVVEVQYKTGMYGNSDLEKAYWDYRIGEKEEAPEGAIRLYATAKGVLAFEAFLDFDPETFALLNVELTKTRRGRSIANSLHFEAGRPVFTERSLAPFDSPVFPLQVSSVLEGTFRRPIGDDLYMEKSYRQEVELVTGIEDAPGEYEGRELLKVQCLSEDGKDTYFVQYWDRDLPWPVYGWNESMTYRLVEQE